MHTPDYRPVTQFASRNFFCRMLTGFALAATLTTPSAHAIELVRDINTSTGLESVVPLAPVDLANVTLVALNDAVHGSELWSTDGTAEGTRLVMDINPGPADSGIASMITLSGIAYFWADDGTNGWELWRSDGTRSGTRIVANIRPDDRIVDGVIAPPILAVNGILYFQNNDGASGEELWRSDGTADGTYLVRDVRAGSASADIDQLTVLGSRLFFTANDGSHGIELWSSDGTPSGTTLVEDINPSTASSSPRDLVASAGTLYFAASDGGVKQPWRATADGQGAELIGEVPNGQQDPSVRDFIPVANGVVFLGSPDVDRLYAAGSSGGMTELASFPYFGLYQMQHFVASGRALFSFRIPVQLGGGRTDVWVTDGTVGGTMPLGMSEPVYGASILDNSVLLEDGRIFLFALTLTSARNLWVTDTTPAGTHPVTDFASGLSLIELAPAGSGVAFAYGHNVDAHGGELWLSEGTLGDARLIKDIRSGAESAGPGMFRSARGKLLFAANDGVHGIEPWISDGTEAGTQGLGDIREISGVDSSNPAAVLELGGILLFTADDGIHGNELWASDGATGGTTLLGDIRPGTESSGPSYFVNMGAYALFMANDGVTGRELWRTDGTPSGTMQVLDIAPGPADGDPLQTSFGAFVLNGMAYFAVTGGDLWRSDGTAAGTELFMDLTTPGEDQATIAVGTLGNRGLFSARVADVSRLWATDGTVGGTSPVSLDVAFQGIGGVEFDGHLYFTGVDASDDAEPWRSDGTSGGTARVADLNESGSSNPDGYVATSDFVAFFACDTSCEYYGLRSSTSVPERLSGALAVLAQDGHHMYFRAQSADSDLIISDGTAAGTHSFLPVNRPFNGSIDLAVYFAGSVVMTVRDATLGPSIWRSDGTEAGTTFVTDVDPGTSADFPPRSYFPIGSRLFVSATEPSTGEELWTLDSDRPNANNDATTTPKNAAVRIAVLENDFVFNGSIDAGSVDIVTAPAGGSATIEAGSGDILYTPQTGWSGYDFLQYRVANEHGALSNVATVGITTRAGAGPDPGDPPTPPPPPPPPPPPDRGGGGGGSSGFLFLAMVASLTVASRYSRNRRQPALARLRSICR